MADTYRYIYIYISYIFLFVQVLYSEYHCAVAADSVRLIGLFRKGHNCAAELRRAQTPQLSRAREVTEQLYEIIGPGNSVILTGSGHRVHSGRTQDITIEPYLLSGEDGIYRDYHYGILQSRKIKFNYLCFNFGAFLTKVKKFGACHSSYYTRFLAKK